MAEKKSRFTKAVEELVKSEELDKILAYASVFEKRKIKKDIALIKSCIGDDGKLTPGCQIPLLHDLKSADVLKDIITFMQMV